MIALGKNHKGQLSTNDEMDVIRPRIVLQDVTLKKVTCGEEHVLLLKTNGSVMVCGSNEFGQIGLGEATKKVKTFTSLEDGAKDIFCGS